VVVVIGGARDEVSGFRFQVSGVGRCSFPDT
jgi:hypothetical protein